MMCLYISDSCIVVVLYIVHIFNSFEFRASILNVLNQVVEIDLWLEQI